MRSMKDAFIARQRQRLAQGGLSRRQFMTSMLAAGVVVPTAMGWADKAMAMTPKKGGSFKMGLGHGSTTDSLDPATYENGFMQNTGYAYGNHLTEVDSDGTLVGDLASGWEATPDAKVWRVGFNMGDDAFWFSVRGIATLSLNEMQCRSRTLPKGKTFRGALLA